VRCLKQWGRSWGSHVAIRRVAFVELFAVKNTWSHSYFDGRMWNASEPTVRRARWDAVSA
jgi:hypothetical protein